MMFIIGTGMLNLPGEPYSAAKCSYSGTPLTAAAALAVARDTARIALAPRMLLLSVPSRAIIALSISR
ncbi:hypothetical protein D3C85_1032960 [compost metagenome]